VSFKTHAQAALGLSGATAAAGMALRRLRAAATALPARAYRAAAASALDDGEQAGGTNVARVMRPPDPSECYYSSDSGGVGS
jgi:hypothetical protein